MLNVGNELWTRDLSAESRDNVVRTPEELAEIVLQFSSSRAWVNHVRLRDGHRWYERLHYSSDHDIWVISWLPGQSTGFHDHGESSGAFVVATGALEEHRIGEKPSMIASGETRSFGFEYAHDVRNSSEAPAVSIHAYSPPLTDMNEFDLDGDRLIPVKRASDRARRRTPERERAEPEMKSAEVAGAYGIEQMLAEARSRFVRLTPHEAEEALSAADAVLVDIRPESQRTIEGHIPNALIIERNVLEWRFDPASSARLPIATDHNLRVIVFCSEGYTSSVAASSLLSLGLWRATDVVGGFQAWRAAGLPVISPFSSEGDY